MKLVILDNQPFIRAGSRTLSPIDASQHFASLVKEAEDALNREGKHRMATRLRYRHALETGQAFDRSELAEADRKVEQARGVLDAARNELQACRQLLTDHLGRKRASESSAVISQTSSDRMTNTCQSRLPIFCS